MKSQRIQLSGSDEERILQILRLAGWYEGRCVDISDVEAHYQEEKVPITSGARAFFREYRRLAPPVWWIYGRRKECPEPDKTDRLDFDFCICPDKDFGPVGVMVYDEYPTISEEQRRIDKVAVEPTTFVGEVGYHFPARIWIGESGTLYTWHFDYDRDKVVVFPSLLEFIKNDLRPFELNYPVFGR